MNPIKSKVEEVIEHKTEPSEILITNQNNNGKSQYSGLRFNANVNLEEEINQVPKTPKLIMIDKENISLAIDKVDNSFSHQVDNGIQRDLRLEVLTVSPPNLNMIIFGDVMGVHTLHLLKEVVFFLKG